MIYKLMDDIHRELNTAKDSEELANKITQAIAGASKGIKDDKIYIKGEINLLLSRKFRARVEGNKLDEVIESYHINYFEPLYDDTLDSEKIKADLDKLTIKKESHRHVKQEKLVQIIYQELYGLSVIDELLDLSDGINEVACNNENYIWIQAYGLKRWLPKLRMRSREQLIEVINKATSFGALTDLNDETPQILCETADGTRVTALRPPYSKEFTLNLRVQRGGFKSKEFLIETGSSSEEVEQFMDYSIAGKANILVIGDQGTGKTNYLLRLMGSYPENTAIGLIESMFELNPDAYFEHINVIKLQNTKSKDAHEMLKTSMRTNRDIIVCGEVRSGEEAVVTLQAMLRQGKGSLGSFHSVSARDALYDFRNLLMQTGLYSSENIAMFDVARGIDLIVHLKLNRATGHRYVNEVVEVQPEVGGEYYKINSIFKYNRETEQLEKVGIPTDKYIEDLYEFGASIEVRDGIRNMFEQGSLGV